MARWILAATILSLALSGCEPEAGEQAPETSINPEQAALLFAERCAICHGETGDGHGPRRRSLYHKPPDFRDPGWSATRTAAELRRSIREGVAGSDMPAWGGQLSQAEIVGLAAHVLRLGNPRQE